MAAIRGINGILKADRTGCVHYHLPTLLIMVAELICRWWKELVSARNIYGYKISLSYHFSSSYTPIRSLNFL